MCFYKQSVDAVSKSGYWVKELDDAIIVIGLKRIVYCCGRFV